LSDQERIDHIRRSGKEPDLRVEVLKEMNDRKAWFKHLEDHNIEGVKQILIKYMNEEVNELHPVAWRNKGTTSLEVALIFANQKDKDPRLAGYITKILLHEGANPYEVAPGILAANRELAKVVMHHRLIYALNHHLETSCNLASVSADVNFSSMVNQDLSEEEKKSEYKKVLNNLKFCIHKFTEIFNNYALDPNSKVYRSEKEYFSTQAVSLFEGKEVDKYGFLKECFDKLSAPAINSATIFRDVNHEKSWFNLAKIVFQYHLSKGKSGQKDSEAQAIFSQVNSWIDQKLQELASPLMAASEEDLSFGAINLDDFDFSIDDERAVPAAKPARPQSLTLNMGVENARG